ncbi:MAG: hypothetical protein AAGK97_18665, partial [Bacteroidota bacterium]
ALELFRELDDPNTLSDIQVSENVSDIEVEDALDHDDVGEVRLSVKDDNPVLDQTSNSDAEVLPPGSDSHARPSRRTAQASRNLVKTLAKKGLL